MRRPWLPGEVRLLGQRYPGEGPSHLATDLGRSEDSVMSMARRLGLRSLHRLRRQVQSRSQKRAGTDGRRLLVTPDGPTFDRRENVPAIASTPASTG